LAFHDNEIGEIIDYEILEFGRSMAKYFLKFLLKE
jgi:hypothetical protein